MLQKLTLTLLVSFSFHLFSMDKNNPHSVLYNAFGIKINQQDTENIPHNPIHFPVEVQRIIASHIDEENKEQLSEIYPLEQMMFMRLVSLYFHDKPNEEPLKKITNPKKVITLAERYFEIHSSQLLESFEAFDEKTQEELNSFIKKKLDNLKDKKTPISYPANCCFFPASGNIPTNPKTISPRQRQVYECLPLPHFP